MNSGRRIAAAVLAAALSMGAIGLNAGPAEAVKDTSWPARVASPAVADTSWPDMGGSSRSLADTSWPD